ncbi:MAG: permease [Hydrogenobaculum sp.]
MKIFEGFMAGFTMGLAYFAVLKMRIKFIFGKKYLYYIGWILSLVVFSMVFLYINKRLAFDITYFMVGILLAQISTVSFYFLKAKKSNYIDQ